MGTFAKKSHVSYRVLLWLGSIVICIVVGAFGYLFREHAVRTFLIILSLVILTISFIKFIDKMGLYVGNEIIYKSFSERKINLSEIVAIKVTPSFSAGGFPKDLYVIKGKDGEPLYSMIFLREKIDGMEQCIGDLYFDYTYHDYIMFYVTYNQSVIDYLLTLNPNIIIF